MTGRKWQQVADRVDHERLPVRRSLDKSTTEVAMMTGMPQLDDQDKSGEESGTVVYG